MFYFYCVKNNGLDWIIKISDKNIYIGKNFLQWLLFVLYLLAFIAPVGFMVISIWFIAHAHKWFGLVILLLLSSKVLLLK